MPVIKFTRDVGRRFKAGMERMLPRQTIKGIEATHGPMSKWAVLIAGGTEALAWEDKADANAVRDMVTRRRQRESQTAAQSRETAVQEDLAAAPSRKIVTKRRRKGQSTRNTKGQFVKTAPPA